MKQLIAIFSVLASSSPAELELEQGTIYGEADERVEIYRGIPYAQPPLGSLRWRPTVSLDSFDGLEQHINSCPQGYTDETENEDCLTLNIFRPADLSENEILPILIYFHGGGNQYGTSHDSLLDGSSTLASTYRQIVVVANFRLGIFGYMNYWDKEPTGGNYGLLDQQKVIEFIRQNAANLQGDKERITIDGESAGAENVLYHLISPESSSMISSAIAQSGAYWWNWNPVSQTEQINQVITELCSRLDQCTVGESVVETIDSLRLCDAESVFSTYDTMCDENPMLYVPFYPVTKDGVFYKEDAREILNQCKSSFTGSAIIGGNSFEGSLLYYDGNPSDVFKPNQIRAVFARLVGFERVPM